MLLFLLFCIYFICLLNFFPRKHCKNTLKLVLLQGRTASDVRENTERVRVADHTGDPAESRRVRWRTHRSVASLAGRSERTRSQEDHLFYRVFIFTLLGEASYGS